MNPLESYYLNQAGSGGNEYAGVVRFQRGRGPILSLLGRIFRPLIPLLKNIGGSFLDSGLNVVQDLRSQQPANFDDFKDSLRTSIKARGKEAIKAAATNALEHVRDNMSSTQKGSGHRRRRRAASRISIKRTSRTKRGRKRGSRTASKGRTRRTTRRRQTRRKTRRNTLKSLEVPPYLK